MSSEDTHPRVTAVIYRGSKREDAYLFVPGPDAFDRVPAPLLEALGQLEQVMELELHRDRKLARADVATVMRSLVEDGYYLQMPPVDSPGQARVQ